MVFELESKTNAILAKLIETPDKTLDCLMHIRYLDENSMLIDELMKKVNYLFECFALMDEYQMVVQDAHRESQQSEIYQLNWKNLAVTISVILDCRIQIVKCKQLLTKQLSEKHILLKHFDECLEDDIKRLLQKVEDVRAEIVKDWLLDENSDPVEVNDMLENLMDKLTNCQKTSEEYQSYQQELNVSHNLSSRWNVYYNHTILVTLSVRWPSLTFISSKK